MPLNLDHFVAASQGHTTAEVYLEKSSRNPAATRLGVRGLAGRLVTSDARLKEDRAEVAAVFRDAILDKIGSHTALLGGAGDALKTLYQRSLKSIAADLEASLDAQIRGDRALTANDIQALTSRLEKKLKETSDKAIETYSKEVHLHGASTLPEAEARQSRAWASLCPNVPLPSGLPTMKLALRAYFSLRPESSPEKLALIDERLDRAAAILGDETTEAIALAEELEALHVDLLGYPIDLAVQRNAVSFNVTGTLGSGSFGTVSSVTVNGEQKVVKNFVGAHSYAITGDNNPALAAGEVKLKRDQELTAAYLRDREKDFIVTPSHFLVNEIVPGRPINKLLVEVKDKEFRAWAKDQIYKNATVPGYQLLIVGEIQDRAEGSDLSKALENGRLKSDMVQPIALSYMNALIAMAKRGFVHGDIKPENTFFDPVSNRLKLIDTGGLTKISKRIEREDGTLSDIDRGVTPAYALPCVADDQKVGFEQDLYSVAASILFVSLTQRGEANTAEDLLDTLGGSTLAVLDGTKTLDQANNDIEGFLELIVSPLATPRERVAIDMMKQAIALSKAGYLTDRDGAVSILQSFKTRL